MIEYIERIDGEHVYARVDFEGGTWIEVPIHGLNAEDVQKKLRVEKEMHEWLLENMPPDL